MNAKTLVLVREKNSKDENFQTLAENWERIQDFRLEDGRKPEVVELPMPNPLYFDGVRLPASYANFYIANEIVLLPFYGESNDAWAESVLHEAFPTRKIVGIDCRELIWGLGAFHCLTQQQPAV